MKNIFPLFLIIFLSCQNGSEQHSNQIKNGIIKKSPDQHIRELRKNDPFNNCPEIKDTAFIDHILNTKLSDPGLKNYISYRPWIEKLTPVGCDGELIVFQDTLSNGDFIQVDMHIAPYDTTGQNIVMDDAQNIIQINGNKPYGAGSRFNPVPEMRIDQLNIMRDKTQFSVPDSIYNKFFEPKLCTFRLQQKIVEAYVDGSSVYIYVFGGIVPNLYMAKLIFDNNKYMGSIVTEYIDLKCFNLFRIEPEWY